MTRKAQLGLGLLMVGLSCLAASPAVAQGEPAPELEIKDNVYKEYAFFHWEGHFSLLNDAPDRSVFSASRGSGLRVGYCWGQGSLFWHLEQNRWLTSEANQVLTDGVFNTGFGGDYRFFEDRVRASLTMGTSTLLFSTLFNDVGTTGYFLDVRPGGLRWSPAEWLTLELHPLSYTLMIPVVTSPRLVHIEYRTVFVTEFRL